MAAEPTSAVATASPVPGVTLVPGILFLGFAVASIGGPLALVTLLPGAAGEAVDSAGLVVLFALALFAAPLGVWLAYSRSVVSAGGLSAFVAAAVGRRTAVVHGWIWAFAYFLYLPYTVTFVVYDLLTPVFPGIGPYRSSLELVLPVAIVLVVLSPLPLVLAGLGAIAVAQLATMLVLAGVVLSHTGPQVAAHPDAGATARAATATALLFICASLALYLGAETRGGGPTVRRGLVVAVAIVGATFFVTAIPLGRVPDAVRDSAVPGASIAQAYSGRDLAVVVGLLTVASTVALIVAEYLALARLLHWMHGAPVRTVLRWIGVPFVAADAVSLLDPERFYNDLLKISLVALFVSQLIVFVTFPRFRRGAGAIGIAAVASGLMAWGLWTVVSGGASS